MVELTSSAAASTIRGNGAGGPLDGAQHRPLRQLVLQKVVEVVVEQAGARTGAYIAVRDHLVVEAVAGVGRRSALGVPTSILERARSAGEAVVLDDATLPNAFSSDESFARRRPRSIACLPVMEEAEVIGLVYLEHDLVPGVFTDERVSALEPLIAQVGELVASADARAELRQRTLAQRHAEAALRASREQLQAILDNMVDGVFVCDASGLLTVVNYSGRGILGLAQSDVLRDTEDVAEMIQARHPDGRPFARDELPLLRALRGEILSSIDMTVTDPRTQRETHLRVNAAPVQDERGAIVGAVAAVTNVTEMVELEHLKGDFVRIAAHELKTPVAIVKGYAETFRRSAKDFPPAQRKMLEALVRGADRIDRIASDLLLLQQLRTGLVELVLEDRLDLVGLAETAVRRLEPDATSGRVKVSAARPVIVRGDRQLLGQVIVNLVANALRYSPGGGRVDVTLDADEREAVVSVTDRGIGIPSDKQPRVFEPFYRAHTDTPYDYGGMGGGLYLAKAIVTRHGGVIGFTSEEGRGSTFTFRLPLRGSAG